MSPSRRARVEILWVLEPASGSVTASEKRSVPAAIPGSQRIFCSSEPCPSTIAPATAGEISSFSSGIPAALTSSSTIASSVSPAPPPP